MKRLIAAILLSALTTSPVYALRPRGADADAMQRAIAGGLEERGFATAASRARTVMTVLRFGLYLMGIQTAHQSALAASRILPDVRDILEALKTAVQLIGDHPLELWVYRPHEVTVVQQALFSERAEVLRRRFFEVFQNSSSSIESLTRALLAVTDGPYRGNLDYEFLVEHRIPALIGEAPATAGDRVRLVRAIRLATIFGLGGNTTVIEGVSNNLTVIQGRLERLIIASGLEEKRIHFGWKAGSLKYQRIVIGPGALTAAAILLRAQESGRNQQFTVLVNSIEQRDSLVQQVQQDSLDRHSSDDWSSWIIVIEKAQDELYDSAYQRTLLEIQQPLRPDYNKPQILLIQGPGEPRISKSGIRTMTIPATLRSDDLEDVLRELIVGYGVSVREKDLPLVRKEFLARRQSYLRLGENL